jgi:hypothetical protein
MKLIHNNRFVGIALAFASFTAAVSAATYTWTDVTGNTSVAGSWAGAISPNGIGLADDILNFNNILTANRAATLNGILTAGTLNIGDTTTTNTFTLAASAGGNLIMGASSGSAAINKALGANGNDVISTGLWYISNAHTEAEIDQAIATVHTVLREDF